MSKVKGSNAERDLVHLFWAHGWTAVRVAGSGSMQYPSPDLLVSKNSKTLAIECKACKTAYQYFDVEEIAQLQEFAAKAGHTPLVAIKFDRTEWLFLAPHQLEKTAKRVGIKKTAALERGKRFYDIAGAKVL